MKRGGREEERERAERREENERGEGQRRTRQIVVEEIMSARKFKGRREEKAFHLLLSSGNGHINHAR